MYFIYNILVLIAGFSLKIIALFNKKINLFIEGRKQTFQKLTSIISKNDNVIWFHCASLGEFEQGRPILEKLKEQYPTYKFVLTFFSPSGYEVRKNYELADVICYLPIDTKQNAKRFLDIVNPELVVFVKYEFWPNLLKELKVRDIKTILISGIFRKNQVFFKWYGAWMRKSLIAFEHFFVQDKNSELLLNNINFLNVTVSGDTRFDRVYEITKQDNQLSFIEKFKDGKYTLVAGSTWKEDEQLLIDYINNKASENEKFIIAPHNINYEDIQKLKNSITKETVLFSEKENLNLSTYQVFIIDTVGILTKIYSYANVAYVGGGYTKSGVHNVLEPATFGIPIIIGPNYYKFNEAIDLVNEEACFVVNDSKKLSVLLSKFFQGNKNREKAGNNALKYVIDKTGATTKILYYLKK
ncbi:glycosyltransferase N-terminal domain-containing protein [uncultured Lutibacter sp.]|uniref:3-deoxy-D-manno-octulosonic acid transferase n=1 Tax=uncultured Lutibacter sp. TaxID=437739 RepID=UPI0026060E58|nr:glycosyltransferase N-terminal domain-containing protein [uncultured Lutibacter sp.]